MSWTSPDDVIDSWVGEDAPSDEDKLQIWINRAESLIRKAIPDIEDRLEESDPDPDLLGNVIAVVTSMVERKFRNPDGTRQLSSTTGPFSEQRTFGGNDPGVLELLDSEVDLLSLYGTGRPRAFTVDLLPVTSRFHPDYVWPWG